MKWDTPDEGIPAAVHPVPIEDILASNDFVEKVYDEIRKRNFPREMAIAECR